MGRRNPDRIAAVEWRAAAETVAEMRERGWSVIAHCARCNLDLVVDLALVARVSGPGASLWNRRQRCRKVGCDGQVEFRAKPPGCSWHFPLDAPEPTREAIRQATPRPMARR